MKRIRSIAITLILVLASGPAIAAMCAEQCAGSALMHAMQVEMPAGDEAMASCHQDDAGKSSQHQQQAEFQNCAMAGCHLQTVSFVSPTRIATADFGPSPLPYFGPFAVSAELPPPIKPPA